MNFLIVSCLFYASISLHGSWGKVTIGGCMSFVRSHSADCFVMKWSPIKAWPSGSGLEAWWWCITWHGSEAVWLILCMKLSTYKNVNTSKLKIAQTNIFSKSELLFSSKFALTQNQSWVFVFFSRLSDSLIRLKVMVCVIRLNYNHDSSSGEP